MQDITAAMAAEITSGTAAVRAAGIARSQRLDDALISGGIENKEAPPPGRGGMGV